MKKRTFDIAFKALNFRFETILDLLSTSGKDMREMMSGILESSLDKLAEVCEIRAEYQVFEDFKFLEKENAFNLEGKRFEVGKLFSASLKNVENVAVFTCTLGKKADELTANEEDLLNAYVLDVASTEIIEATARYIENEILQEAKEEQNTLTNRYAPGYCGWDLQEQHKLFQLLGENYCGIELTSNVLMQPVKSLSGIFGIGKNVKHVKYACQLCNSQNCIYRNRR